MFRVHFDGARLQPQEVHRFPNHPVLAAGVLHWDALRLWHEIQQGIEQAAPNAASLGLATWGVDFALIDRNGDLVSNPVSYRDMRTNGMMEWVWNRVPRRTIFERTGIQMMQINGLYQLAALLKANSPQLETAATLLTMPDLFNYWLSGAKVSEFTNATTMQFYNPHAMAWDTDTLDELGIRTDFLPQVVSPGTRLGEYRGIAVIAPSCHDTGSAVVAVPTTSADYAYISSGTWSLIGLELPQPVINDESYAANITNEGGYENTFRLLKNVCGMWIAQQSRLTWRAQGNEYSYEELARLALDVEPFESFIDVDDPAFLPPGDMPTRIREFCQQSGQAVPETVGQIMRIAYESLAMKYRLILDKMIALTGRSVTRMHIIGGGSQNAVLCQMTADALNLPVIAGPVEATTLGIAIAQWIALGELANVAQARELLSRTVNTTLYEPKDAARWAEAYTRYQAYVTTV